MEMTRDFIRETIKSIKAEKDKIKNDLMSKFSMLEGMMATMGSNIENSFRFNFPQNPTMPMVIHQGAIASIISVGGDCIDILQGNTEVVTTFKRHIDFLKLVSDPNQRERLDKTFKKYFVYWDNKYFVDTYVKELSQDAKTAIPNPILSLDRVSNILGYKAKDSISVRSSESDIWEYNAPVEYSYNNGMNMFDLIFDSSLQTTAGLSALNSCPDLDINISHAINRMYQEKFGFDYFKFKEVNEEFIAFITNLLITFLFTRYKDILEIKEPSWRYSGYSTDLVYEQDFKVTYYSTKAVFKFEFYRPGTEEESHPNKQFIEITVEDWQSNTECRVKVKLSNVSQSLWFTLFDRNNQDSAIVFDGYMKQDSDKNRETVLQYFSEDYKLFVLYYGGQMLAKKDEYLLKLNNGITNKLAEQKAEEAAKNANAE